MRKTIIWDLDNTLYFETEEYKNKLNEATAAAAIKEFNVPLDFKEATEKVKESYATYRDGLEIFSREYGIPHKDLYVSYHNYKSELVKTIAPYEGLLENLKSLQCCLLYTSSGTHAKRLFFNVAINAISQYICCKIYIKIIIRATQ